MAHIILSTCEFCTLKETYIEGVAVLCAYRRMRTCLFWAKLANTSSNLVYCLIAFFLATKIHS